MTCQTATAVCDARKRDFHDMLQAFENGPPSSVLSILVCGCQHLPGSHALGIEIERSLSVIYLVEYYGMFYIVFVREYT